MKPLKEAIRLARHEKRLKQWQVAEKVNVTQQTVGAWEKGTVPTPDSWKGIMDTLGVDVSIFKESEKYKGSRYTEIKGKLSSVVGEISASQDIDSPHFTNVQKAKPSLSAGNGSFVIEDGVEGTYHFRTDWLHRVCNPNDAILFDVEGDSMEPTILGGDTVLVDKGKTEFEEDKIFAIGVGDIVFVKRLRMDLLSQKVKVISDNKLKYDPDVVDQDELRILGKVVWRGGEV